MRRASMLLLFALPPCFATLLVGCTPPGEYVRNGFKVGPNYSTPPASVADDWLNSTDKRKDAEDLTRWWKVFNDPILDELVCTAYAQNLTLRQAGARILQARALRGIAVGSLFPQSQFLSGDYTTTALSNETVNGSLARQRVFGQWSFGFNLAWEADFWGRFRRGIESASANLDASVADYDDVLVTLLGDVAANYVQMRTIEQRIVDANRNVKIQNETAEKAKQRVKVDANGELNLDQADTLLKQTEAGIPELEISLQQARNALAVLLGVTPVAMQATLNELQKKHGPRGIPRVVPDVALGVPADLLRRRPDIRRAERQAAAQCALIGVAESDFYPRISLSGNLGYSAQQFKNLFNQQAFTGSFGPSFEWDVLNYGRILNNVRLQDAHFQELTAAYQNRVLVAQSEVEDGLIVFLKAQQRVKLQELSVKSADKAEKIARAGWLLGNVSFTTLSLIQQNKVQQEDTLAQAQGEIALGLIQVYRALGGGWQIRCEGCEPPVIHESSVVRPASSETRVPIVRLGPPS